MAPQSQSDSELASLYAWIMRAERLRVRGVQTSLVPFVLFISLLAVLSIAFIVPFKMSASNQPTTSAVEYLLYICLGATFVCFPVAIFGALVWAVGDTWMRKRSRQLDADAGFSHQPRLIAGERLGWWIVRDASDELITLRRQPIPAAVWTPLRWFIRFMITTFVVASIVAGVEGGEVLLGFCAAAVSAAWGFAATSFMMEREVQVRAPSHDEGTFVIRKWFDPLLKPRQLNIVPVRILSGNEKDGVCLHIYTDRLTSHRIDRLAPGPLGQWQAERLRHAIESLWIQANRNQH